MAAHSFFPRWSLKTEGVILPEERLPPGQTVLIGLQHVVAMFGATVLAPLLMGFDPNVAILFSGVATLIFFVVVGGRVRSEEHTSELQSRQYLVCRLLLEKKKSTASSRSPLASGVRTDTR